MAMPVKRYRDNLADRCLMLEECLLDLLFAASDSDCLCETAVLPESGNCQLEQASEMQL